MGTSHDALNNAYVDTPRTPLTLLVLTPLFMPLVLPLLTPPTLPFILLTLTSWSALSTDFMDVSQYDLNTAGIDTPRLL